MTDETNPNFCDRVIGKAHTAADHDACERRRIDYLRDQPKTGPTYKVSGNHLRLFRLDAEGNPVGAGIEFPGPVSFGLAADEVEDMRIDWPTETVSIEMQMCDVDPAVMALLTGYALAPRPWYWRYLPKRVKHWAKQRELRRGYGG